jgi:predicted ATPase with chaperone activity
MQWSVVHNVLMIGPPGAGKILLARTFAGLAGSEAIGSKHLAEARQYHPRMIMVYNLKISTIRTESCSCFAGHAKSDL